MIGCSKVNTYGHEMKIGYARVSTTDQDLSGQVESLKKAGCEKIWEAKLSAVSKEHDEKLTETINFCRDGDVLVVTRLDRLGRSLSKILLAIERVHEKGATIRSLDGSIDTSNQSPLATAMISLCGTFAQLERDLILDRTTEGRERAKAQGKHMGRPPRLSEKQQKDVLKRLEAKESVSSIARLYRVSRTTIQRVRDRSI